MSTSRPLRWVVPALLVLCWLAVGGFGGPFTGKLSDVATNDSSAFLPKSAESTEVQDELRAFRTAQVLPAIVVAERGSGVTPQDTGFLTTVAQAIQRDPAVATPLGAPVPAKDGRALQLAIPLEAGDKPGEAVDRIRALLTSPPAGLTVLVTGPAAQIADLVTAFGGIDGILLLVAGLVVALILVLVYRSVLLPVLVLLSAVFALGLAALAVYVLADHGVLTLNGQSQGILFILVFGAATDYALLLVSRFREQLRDTEHRLDAIHLAWRATLAPIVASAGTVILGVLCLLFSDLQSNRGLGPVAAIGIAAALLSATTFLPAALALTGRAAFWPLRPKFGSEHPENRGIWARVARRVGAHPRVLWAGTAIVLLVGAAFVPQLKAGGVAQSDLFLTTVDSVTGQDVLTRHFPGGTGSPTIILTDSAKTTEVTLAAHVEGVAQTTPAASANGRTQVLAVLADPADSEAALATVQRIRDAVHPIDGTLVGGQTATQLDTQHTSQRDRALIIPIVLVVIFLVLALLLRALVAPLLLIATVVLSFAATMGVSALVFDHVLGFPGADPAVPLFGFVFLVALGVDYNIFLMTRVREETAEHGTRQGVLNGLTLTGGVITSAGVVLAATFAALAVIPILFLAQIAFIVAFGVLLDTLVVRSLLVPALALDLGKRVWWPSRLG
ncbi:MMPL family transporter [Amycolatopsis sacchari]|uniref:Putative drug exporter of the RND superfamily n=1 Tax=Amycolatopsis sacchari TaxID=115433 RepID=A0A1I4BWW9_9PSEU|nr:efflux RND transporter permease subunit [Amycolatopsis sacchari]SFK72421.1 putative drug exporter of the RND superfamily [Amycolatopsis sacchari]